MVKKSGKKGDGIVIESDTVYVLFSEYIVFSNVMDTAESE